MKISVLIPAYNCEATIRAALDSVLRQTLPPDEILVLDDGSTDQTPAILGTYEPRVTVFHQPNRGVASARNALCQRAQGELIAVLDSDDVWHPKYLEVQRELFEAHPNAVAFFTAHVDFRSDGDYRWETDPAAAPFSVEVIPSLDFFRRYNKATGPFGCFSYCCIPRGALTQLGCEPFKGRAAEDSYCCYLLSLLGPVVYASAALVAYRVRTGTLSTNHLWTFREWVRIFELLEDQYKRSASKDLHMAFREAFVSKRRAYAKLLMGSGEVAEAREQLWRSLSDSHSVISAAKSAALLFLSCLPRPLQPTWPPPHREVKVSGNAGTT